MEQEPKRSWRESLRSVVSVALSMSLVMVCCLTAARSIRWEETVDAFAQQPAGAERALIPMGKAIGIKMFSDGVMVVGLSSVETGAGSYCPGRDCGLKEGDVITHVNGTEVDTIEEVQRVLSEREGSPLTIRCMRGEKRLKFSAEPVRNRKGEYQLGVWLRDSMAGIGTMTFYDPDTGTFGALGHGINDVDTSVLMPLDSGGIMGATISDVKKGIGGQPGELHGEFNLAEDMGTLCANTGRGVFGKLRNKSAVEGRKPMPMASPDQVRTGEATVLTNVRGDRTEEFLVEITHVDRDTDGTRNLMIKVTDPRLLELTGGIVQGMSGSPIIQNGKLIGAVTHVLVNDPTRGYGIFIENMLEAAE